MVNGTVYILGGKLGESILDGNLDENVFSGNEYNRDKILEIRFKFNKRVLKRYNKRD